MTIAAHTAAPSAAELSRRRGILRPSAPSGSVADKGTAPPAAVVRVPVPRVDTSEGAELDETLLDMCAESFMRWHSVAWGRKNLGPAVDHLLREAGVTFGKHRLLYTRYLGAAVRRSGYVQKEPGECVVRARGGEKVPREAAGTAPSWLQREREAWKVRQGITGVA